MSRRRSGNGQRRPRAGERLAGMDELEVEIEKLIAGGEGLARFEGIPIFVPLSAPGDRLRVRLTERRPDYGRAEILEVLRPGRGRRRPPCPYFGECGGCQLQHLEDDLQLDLKAAALAETLKRLGGLGDLPMGRVLSGSAWGYRMRAQLHTEQRGDATVAGYFARRTHDLVAVERCPILVPELEAVLGRLAGLLPSSAPRRLELAAGDGGRVSASPPVGGLPRGELALRTGDHTYEFDARCFFQAHRELLPALIETAVGDHRGERALDLYAGVGLFSLPLASRYRQVVAVDSDRVAVRYARRNLRRESLRNLEVVCRAVETWISELPTGVDRVVVDPPRGGLPRAVRQALKDKAPSRLTYVSCHPAALARDLHDLSQVFEIERLDLVDLFPQTGHLEVVAQLIAAGWESRNAGTGY